ncbi:hypothetical protein TVAG_479640 [Trichomonas vaginalis G3]|uniref:Uncharacterized protein n=1 Tax=Trichomonas vaginalis (strain ATCC PRA-98 / G3) TaxID=412133 RepID=A2FLM6_TRIV3|nr:protein of unknown function, DUF1304 family [Trichomonas vaginalis G3]EAX94199.1 hypothetical protein TVAG_479640 [Trichomonas vaginalis G3]KAI5498400.1 protein of unknown function, DUF1304 family [Trichomonas vaginalis G3]|eukprot:XP_001307129.1 hypothetical protein [Trichomonas vaginalis G3]
MELRLSRMENMNVELKSDNWLMAILILVGLIFLFISVLMHLYLAYLLMFRWKTAFAQKLFKYPGDKVDDAEPLAKIVALYSISFSVVSIIAASYYFARIGRYALPWVVCGLGPKCFVGLYVFAAYPQNWLNATILFTPPLTALVCLLLSFK